MSEGHEVAVKVCEREGCERSYKNHKWGTIKAFSEGWFTKKTGEAWCPEHVPRGAQEWRERNKK